MSAGIRTRIMSGNNQLPEEAKLCRHRRAVGPPEDYDVIGALQFMLLVNLGLRDTHYLLDIGCGSLRAGKLLIPYLNPGRYVGIEPHMNLVRDGVAIELGHDIAMPRGAVLEGPKGSTFWGIGDFDLSFIGLKFDFVLAHSIFTHAPKRMIERCLAEASKVMHKDSVFAFTYMHGPDFIGEKFESGPGSVMATYTEKTMMKMVSDAKLYASHIDWPHPYGQLWVIVRKDRSKFPAMRFCDAAVIHHINNGGH